MNFYIISRPPGDDFSFKLLYQTLSEITYKENIDCFYSHSYHLDHHFYQDNKTVDPITLDQEYHELLTGPKNRNFLEKHIKSKNILIAVKDHLSGDKQFYNDYLHTLDYFRFLFYKHLDKNFIFCTSLENLNNYIFEKHVKIVNMGGDIVNQSIGYKKIKPIINKNFNSEYNFIFLNRNFRIHRMLSLCLLFSFDLKNTGLVSCMFHDNLDQYEHHLIDVPDDNLRKKMFTGFNRLKKHKNIINDDFDIYKGSANDNISNFNNRLSDLYKNTFIEIVSETTFFEKCFLITEKTANCFLGCNFPIILNSKGSVEFLRTIGFDMFDDIINHDYDTISDPFERLYCAIHDNKEILFNSEILKLLWKKNINRFLKNVNCLQNTMYDFYSNRFQKELINAFKDEI